MGIICYVVCIYTKIKMSQSENLYSFMFSIVATYQMNSISEHCISWTTDQKLCGQK